MASSFVIQEWSQSHSTWHPVTDYQLRDGVVEGESVDALRRELVDFADRTSFPYWTRFRIITREGAIIEHWKIKPGVARCRGWRRGLTAE